MKNKAAAVRSININADDGNGSSSSNQTKGGMDQLQYFNDVYTHAQTEQRINRKIKQRENFKLK